MLRRLAPDLQLPRRQPLLDEPVTLHQRHKHALAPGGRYAGGGAVDLDAEAGNVRFVVCVWEGYAGVRGAGVGRGQCGGEGRVTV